MYEIHIIWCGIIIASGLWRVKLFQLSVPENVELLVFYIYAQLICNVDHMSYIEWYTHFRFRPPSWILKVTFDVAVRGKHFPWLHRPEKSLLACCADVQTTAVVCEPCTQFRKSKGHFSKFKVMPLHNRKRYQISMYSFQLWTANPLLRKSLNFPSQFWWTVCGRP